MNAFPPPRQRGFIIHLALIVVFSLAAVSMFWLLFQTPVGLFFALYLVLFLLAVIPVPILAYRAYALTRGNYLLDRNILRLTWGLRVEDIPVADVEWIRPVQGLLAPLTLPLLRLPGSILGVTRQWDIGDVEFLASEKTTLLLVATHRRVYAISPEDPARFAAAFQKVIEMGSLQRGESRSQFPSFLVGIAWENPVARYLWLAGLFLNIGSLVWVSVIAPGAQSVPFGFGPDGSPLEVGPAVQLILLPMLSAVLFVIGWLLGLFFYRRTDQQIHALAVWASSTLTSFGFLVAIFFLLTTPR